MMTMNEGPKHAPEVLFAYFLDDCFFTYYAARNKFERFRGGGLELTSRFEFKFRRRGNYIFERFEFLVCSKFNHTQCGRTCACAVACLCPQNSNSNVVASLTIDNNIYIYIDM